MEQTDIREWILSQANPFSREAYPDAFVSGYACSILRRIMDESLSPEQLRGIMDYVPSLEESNLTTESVLANGHWTAGAIEGLIPGPTMFPQVEQLFACNPDPSCGMSDVFSERV